MRIAGIVCWMAVVACLAGAGNASAAEGRFLNALRGEVDEPVAPEASADDAGQDSQDPPWSGRKGRSGSEDDCHDRHRGRLSLFSFGPPSYDEDCDRFDRIASWAFLYCITSPWWVPNVALESEDDLLAGFPVAPYVMGHDGYLVFDSPELETSKIKTGLWGGRLSLDTGDNFSGVTTLTGRLRLDTTTRFGLDTEWVHLAERHPGGFDWLGRGDCNLVVRFAQSSRIQLHSGVGINWLADRNNADVGFNFTYGVDFFPVDPVVTSATLDLGRIGDASLIHFRGTLGAMVTPRLHLYTGYDLLNLEGASIHSFLTGLEFWF